MSDEYGAGQIQILEGLEAVRNVRACISEAHLREGFTIWYMR